MNERTPEFKRLQYNFAAHIRDPKSNKRPDDVEDRRMAVYRELFYNNVQGFIEGGFPILRKLYTDEDWHRMVRDFFSNHECHTPYFLEISQEFLKYLEREREPQPEDPPFAYQLAHYEWVELALSVAEDEPDWEHIDPHGDLLEGQPVLSPLAWLLSYDYPVHQISPEFQPQEPSEQPTYLMVYRDSNDDVGFKELNPLTARLLSLIEEQTDKTGRQLLQQIAEEMQHPEPETIIQGGLQILAQLREEDIVLGTKK